MGSRKEAGYVVIGFYRLVMSSLEAAHDGDGVPVAPTRIFD